MQKDEPFIYAEGSGATLSDIHGMSYLDMMSAGSRASSLGYGNEEIARAMYEQAVRAHYVGTTSALTGPMINLATKVASLAPGRLTKMMFVSGGSEAVEVALKLAKQYQQ
jgi:adenosylmethionine-8-amino-7-oxononanoate aminotransferase